MSQGKAKEPEENELWPIKLGHGPKLRFEDDQIVVWLSSNENHFDVGSGDGEARELVTYTTQITADSRDALTMAGRHVTGWMILDSQGTMLARLASDDERVYRRADIERFAALAGLTIKDWGEVPVTRIDKLMVSPQSNVRTNRRVSRREWIIAGAVLGGMMITWPITSHITYDGNSDRQEALMIFALGLIGFVVAALWLGIGRALANFSGKPLTIAFFTIAGALAVASVFSGWNGYTYWELTSGQLAAVILGLGLEFASVPLWAYITHEGIAAVKRANPLEIR
ncbi:MAG: hypothetical protein LBM94_05580 [Propionibacteriaceae bacterium]|jgi:hypothetical protein|nr:hypothetical protein [Propionibacteriaceae bacterium]